MQRFSACVDTLRRNGQGYLVPDDSPVHGIGHSNGALLHLLIGSIYAPASASNILISFNNKCVPLKFVPSRSKVHIISTFAAQVTLLYCWPC